MSIKIFHLRAKGEPINQTTQSCDCDLSHLKSGMSIVQKVSYTSVTDPGSHVPCPLSQVPVSSHCYADLALALPPRFLSPREKRAPSLSLLFLCEEKLFGDLVKWWFTYGLCPMDLQSLLILGRQWSFSFFFDGLVYLCCIRAVIFRL